METVSTIQDPWDIEEGEIQRLEKQIERLHIARNERFRLATAAHTLGLLELDDEQTIELRIFDSHLGEWKTFRVTRNEPKVGQR